MVDMTDISTASAVRREDARNRRTGEFGVHTHSDPEAGLAAVPGWPDDLGVTHVPGQWGTVDVAYGSRTPWGPAQHPERVADGIVFVPTDGHGGYKLSPQRNAAIPAAYRNRNGWYEEDCERRFVDLYHFDAVYPNRQDDRAQALAECDESIRDWYPDAWEKVNGRTLEPGESHTKDERTWSAAHADDFVVESQSTLEDGTLKLWAIRRATGDRDEFVVSREARDAARDAHLGDIGAGSRFLVPEGAQPLPRPAPKPATPGYTTVPETSGLTPSAAQKVTADLNQRWRLSASGVVLTLREQIQQGHITAKRVDINDNGVREFRLENENTSSSVKVSKATFDAFEAPDTRTERDRAMEAYRIASAKRDKAQRRVDGTWHPTMVMLQDLRAATAAANAALKAYQSTAP